MQISQITPCNRIAVCTVLSLQHGVFTQIVGGLLCLPLNIRHHATLDLFHVMLGGSVAEWFRALELKSGGP